MKTTLIILSSFICLTTFAQTYQPDTLRLYDAYCEANNPNEIDTTIFSYGNDTLYIRNIHNAFCSSENYRAVVKTEEDTIKIDVVFIGGSDCLADCSMGYTIKFPLESFDTLNLKIIDESFTINKADIMMPGISEFAPIGAEWYYSYDPDVTLDDGYQKIEVIGDTLIDNINCKILQKTNIGYSYRDNDYYEIDAGTNIIYEEDSVVYYKKDSLFYVLYDFKAKAGDSYSSISFTENCSQQFQVKIDSIGSIENNGRTLRKYYVTLDDSFQTYYIERIGYPNYLFPNFQTGCEIVTGSHYPGPLRCYTDDVIGNFSTNIVSSCDFITSLKEQKQRNDSVKIYPNPSQTQESIQIEIFNKNIKRFDLFSSLGRKIESYSVINETRTTISIKNPGIFFICFIDGNDNIIGREKISIK